MKQIFLSGQGQIEVFDVPVPSKLTKSVLVRNAYSLISTGTEGAAVTSRRGVMGLYEKAISSKDRMEHVWQIAKQQGVSQTFDLIRNKLNDYTAIGYTCAGRVIEVSDDDIPYKPGQRVACMGAGLASHAEFVSVPKNLIASIPDNVSYEEAAFGAIACIAMQGIRRLEARPGEKIGVIGLGLIGQVASRLLVALGYSVVGLDLSEERAKLANRQVGVDAWAAPSSESLSRVQEITGGSGLDGVVVCASGKGDGPVDLAFDLCRQRGSVSIVGDVGMNLKRAKMYAKELDLRMSCSYGPGRYDTGYELEGIDYPFGFVRWTEGRNLELFLSLLSTKRLDITDLISRKYEVENAREAYEHIKKAEFDTYGVLIDYGLNDNLPGITRDATTQRHLEAAKNIEGKINFGLIGAGGYTKAVHVPNIERLNDKFQIFGVASRTGATAALLAKKAKAALSTSDYKQLLENKDIDAILISTRHATHGKIALEALHAGKHVFIEKPMCLDVGQGKAIADLAAKKGLVVRVGYNRRYAPMLLAAKKAVGACGKRVMVCHVNIGPGGTNHWSNTRDEGGRFMGEGVHFLDLCNWFAGEYPESLNASFMGEADELNPNVSVNIVYKNGTVCNVLYTTEGSTQMGKEYFEMHGNGVSVRSDNFNSLTIKGGRGPLFKIKKGLKGQLEELDEFAAAIQGKSKVTDPADAKAGWIATWMVKAAIQSAQEKKCILLEDSL